MVSGGVTPDLLGGEGFLYVLLWSWRDKASGAHVLFVAGERLMLGILYPSRSSRKYHNYVLSK